MDEKNLKIVSNLIGNSYLNIAQKSRNSFSKKIKILFEHKKIPKIGFSDNEIEILLREISNMDANNFDSFCGVGEREGRIYSNLVRNRHFGYSHGIGRSGDINSIQPKAAGSSIINKLTNNLVLHLLQESGMKSMKKALLIPMATGMSLSLVMLLLRSERPLAKYVIWSRIDQKSCFKCIKTAGFEPIIIETISLGDELQTNTVAIKMAIESLGAENILCILTTTSCFAPRVPDNIMKVGQISQDFLVPHVINNAYGVTLKRCMNVINEACIKYGKKGVYAVVQSTDKNLMVPVGGAIVASCDEEIINKLSALYSGRASISPTLDVFITLLSMGLDQYENLIETREINFKYLREKLVKIAEKFGLRVMDTPHNPVSIAVTLRQHSVGDKSITGIGSELFYRNISGARVVECAMTNPKKTIIEGHEFIGFGSHSETSSIDYLNAAAAIGQTKAEIERFVDNLDNSLTKFYTTKCGDH